MKENSPSLFTRFARFLTRGTVYPKSPRRRHDERDDDSKRRRRRRRRSKVFFFLPDGSRELVRARRRVDDDGYDDDDDTFNRVTNVATIQSSDVLASTAAQSALFDEEDRKSVV